MKKSLLILGLVASSWLSAGSPTNEKEAKTVFPTKIERSAFKIDILKAKILTIQLQDKNQKSLERSIKLLNELKPIIAKLERDLIQN
ncbi:hypothetical protein NMK71_08785 [Weeksellaceae bacterium KMM 9713]|uniref:Uncharacterized protein n=1 Tax=Profundicola chukchiensis TaxID=2961959 RepID=A0A9X4MZI2_9FLAO|nr:hypothetical protein [Profundicola chukchiensis]MDG4946507.1 hypothetical protein [Profundicola chukchiensis]